MFIPALYLEKRLKTLNWGFSVALVGGVGYFSNICSKSKKKLKRA
jgi:hypothetical protein